MQGPFYTTNVPQMWSATIAVFGRMVIYHLVEGGTVPELLVILKEGSEDEPKSPGRYSKMQLRNSEIGRGAVRGDWVDVDSDTYEVVRVDNMLVGISEVTLHLTRGVAR